MATQINGYRLLLSPEYDTYNHWRSYCLTHGINVDFSYGNQCWDSPALLWYQYGLRLETGNGYAYGCWTLKKDVNAKFPFTKVEGAKNIKRGDCLVFAPSGLNYTGHICFADTDYKDRYWDDEFECWRISCLGQNQGQGVISGTPSNIVGVNLANFLGAFRNSFWRTEPEPTPTKKPSNFPFVLYSRKFRNPNL